MKHPLLTLSLLLCPLLTSAVVSAPASVVEAAPPTPSMDAGVINGVVKDSTTKNPVENALVVLQCSCLDGQREAMTNARGVYQFSGLPPGNYTIQVLAGKANVSKITALPRGAKFRANFSIDPDTDHVVQIVVEATPLTSSPSSMKISMEEAKKLPVGSSSSRDFTAVVDLAPSASRDGARIRVEGTTDAETTKTVDSQDRAPRAGTLTAGTLDDNLDSSELHAFANSSFQQGSLERSLGLGPRAEIVVVDAAGRPVNDAKLRVSVAGKGAKNGQGITLRTGTDGRAVVNGAWDLGLQTSPKQAPRSPSTRIHIVANKGGAEAVEDAVLGAKPIRIQLPLKRPEAEAQVAALDLVLVVDTTGSMTDELNWLAAELRAVIGRSLADHPRVDARLGVVAYRDLGDTYVTRSFELSVQHGDFETFLVRQSADGGGDYPEAVDAALAEAARFDWRHDEQAAKVVLLVADAPPHDAHLRQTFEAASELRSAGVSLYPVASSGVEAQAELVFRVLAADTAAQYLFLTDDSGIGNPHADPHADNYTVELLSDALSRILAAELAGQQARLPGSAKPRSIKSTPSTRATARDGAPRPARAAFALQRSMFDDGGLREIAGGPAISFDLH